MFEKVLRLGIFISCVVGFLWITLSHWKVYSSERLSTSTEYVPNRKQKYPVIVFCPSRKYKVGEKVERFSNDQNKLEHVDVQFNGLARYEFGSRDYPRNITLDVITMYNGWCKSFHLPDEHDIRSVLVFEVRSQEPVTVFYLTDPIDLIFLIFLTFPIEPYSFVLNRNLLSEIRPSKVHIANTAKRREAKSVCREDRANTAFAECMVDKLENSLMQNDVKCLPMYLFHMLPNFKRDFCNDGQSEEVLRVINISTYTLAQVWGDSGPKYSCQSSCLITSYKVTNYPIAYDETLSTYDTKMMYIRMANPFVENITEYLVYNFIDIFSSTGGTLGIFLGWSIYQNGWPLIVYIQQMILKAAMMKKKKRTKPEADKKAVTTKGNYEGSRKDSGKPGAL